MLLLLLLITAEPDWVKNGGSSPKYPRQEYLTGFAAVEGADAESAKSQAAVQLAQQISIRIESDMAEVSAEKNGKQAYEVTAFTRASSDVRMSGLQFQTYNQTGKTYAFCWLSKAQATKDRRDARDQAMTEAKEIVARAERAEKNAEAEAMRAYLQARLKLAEALDHDAVVRALGGGDKDLVANAAALNSHIDERLAALQRRPVSSLEDCVATLAIQLGQQGLGTGVQLTAAPLTFGTTAFSSPFGRQVALDLESALARTKPLGKMPGAAIAIKGTYIESEDSVRVVVVARNAEKGTTVASAEAGAKKASLPKDLPLVPQNLQQALRDQKILGQGEELGGALTVEVWTSKGRSGLVYRNKEELRFFIKVNKAAWVRIVYILASGAKVPVTQGYFIDEAKANFAVEYPDTFEVSAPFGAERVHVAAFTDKPAALPTEERVIDGEKYSVVTETQALVKHRGLQKKKGATESAEALLSITTMP